MHRLQCPIVLLAICLDQGFGTGFRASGGQGQEWCELFDKSAKCTHERCVATKTDCVTDPDGGVDCKKREWNVGWCGASIETRYKNHYEKYAPIVAARADDPGSDVGDCQSLFEVFKVSFNALVKGTGPVVPDNARCSIEQLVRAAGSVEVLHAFTQLLLYSPMGRRMEISDAHRDMSDHLVAVERILNIKGRKWWKMEKRQYYEFFALSGLFISSSDFRGSPEDKKYVALQLKSAMQDVAWLVGKGPEADGWTDYLTWLIDVIQSWRHTKHAASFDSTLLEPFLDASRLGDLDCSVRDFAEQGYAALQARFGPIIGSIVKDPLVGAIQSVVPGFELAAGTDGFLPGFADGPVLRKPYLARQALIAAVDSLARGSGQCLVRGLRLLNDAPVADGNRVDPQYTKYLNHLKSALARPNERNELMKATRWLLSLGPFRP